MTETQSSAIPSVEMVARAWHALSDEPVDAVAFDGEGCTCRNWAPYALRVIKLFFGPPTPEPDGLGAVVVNPFTSDVWVRAAHPALPWNDPATFAPQEWCDPTSEDWFMWADLPQPLVVHSTGWTPPTAAATPNRPAMTPEEIKEYTDAVMVKFMPVLRATVNTWARFGVAAPEPQRLADTLIESALGPIDHAKTTHLDYMERGIGGRFGPTSDRVGDSEEQP